MHSFVLPLEIHAAQQPLRALLNMDTHSTRLGWHLHLCTAFPVHFSSEADRMVNCTVSSRWVLNMHTCE